MGEMVELGSTLLDRASLAGVCRRYRVKGLWLFGSAARGEATPDSDIDTMVEFEPAARIGLIQFEKPAEELTSLTGRRVDLVTRRGLKPWVRAGILRDLRVLYAA
jgi:predicted nucleotidyltransferase